MNGQSFSRASTTAFSQQSTIAPSNSPRAGQALKDAIGRFRARLDGEQLTTIRKTTYPDLCYQIQLIQRKQAAEKKMMNLARIREFLQAMERFGKVIEVFLNTNDAVAFVWGPMKLVLMTASMWGDSFELLLEAYEAIGEYLPLLPEYETMFTEHEYLKETLELVYIDILEFHEHAMRFFSQHLWKQFVKSMWKNFKSRFEGILSNLKRHKHILDQCATLAQHQIYLAEMDSIKSKLDQKIAEEEQKKLKAVSAWLAPGQQQSVDHEKISADRKASPGTAKWILETGYIKAWLNASIVSNPLGWLTGIPGAGKTILASSIIDQCFNLQDEQSVDEQAEGDRTCLVGFFYCQPGDHATNSAVSILGGLLAQFLFQNKSILPWFYTRYTQSGEAALQSIEKARSMFKSYCISVLFDKFTCASQRMYVVVDGLDECAAAERKYISTLFMELAHECDMIEAGRIRLLIISQDYSDIEKALKNSATDKVSPMITRIQTGDNEADIQHFVDRQVSLIDEKHGPLAEDVKKHVRTWTLRNAGGMFLYARLVMDLFYGQITQRDLINAIYGQAFPQGLKEAYARIIDRIQRSASPDEWSMAKKLLGWMICAKRRLTWREIQVALSINIKDQEIDYEQNHLRIHIRDICGSLISLSGDRVSLMHGTAKHYLTRVSQYIHEPSIECELTALCLQYLTFPCFKLTEGDDEDELQEMALRGHFAFQDYAVAKWPDHVASLINQGPQLFSDAINLNRSFPDLTDALDEFMTRFDEEEWHKHQVDVSREKCSIFEQQDFFENLFLLASYIHIYLNKGFEARHKVAISSMSGALERNREILEKIPIRLKDHTAQLKQYSEFYDLEHRFKCNRVTCMRFWDGFKDAAAKKRHVNAHDRGHFCDVTDCIGTAGFASAKDLEKHTKNFHPDAHQFSETFNSAVPDRPGSKHVCSIPSCGKTFSRAYHRVDHEKSHRGEKPHVCPECGRAFTRHSDLMRHKKIHNRK